MVSNDPSHVNYFLSDLSERDKVWDKHKSDSVQISNALSLNRDFRKRGHSLNECADWLLYNFTDDLEKPFKLSKANFCRDRACPVCQWRRSLRWTATMHKQLPAVQDKYPKHKWIFVTLTVRNCPISELRNNVQAMNKAFNALMRKLKKRLGDVGYIKATEVTRGKDDTAHPHFHVMFLVPQDYFKKKYIKQSLWTEMWQEALKCDYSPIVDVRTIRPKKMAKNGSVGVQNDAVASALAETIKYGAKPSDLLKTQNQGDYGWLYEYLRQAKGLRFISIGGILKGLVKAEWKSDDEDLVHVGDGDDEASNEDNKPNVKFDFDRMMWRYKI